MLANSKNWVKSFAIHCISKIYIIYIYINLIFYFIFFKITSIISFRQRVPFLQRWFLMHYKLLRCLLLNFYLFYCHIRVHCCCLLNCFCQSSIMINRIAIWLYRNFLFYTSFYNSISFSFILKMQSRMYLTDTNN